MAQLSNLPSDIMLEILTRLPTESVLECKLVCKPWRSLVSHHPSFTGIHLARLLNHDSDSASKLTFLTLTEVEFQEHTLRPLPHCQQFHYLEYNENHGYSITRMNLTPPFKSYSIIGSQNGLICLESHRLSSNRRVCVCNPITKEYVILPESNKVRNPDKINFRVCTGFGYLPETNEYKVVRINFRKEWFKRNTDSVCVEICTLGTGNGWRNLGEYRLSFSVHTFHYEYAVFANETLYWIPIDGKIVAFNLVDEHFYELPTLPCDFREIGILGDDLCCFKNHSWERKTSIWLLKKIVNQNMMEQEEYLSLTWSEEFVGYHLQPLALMNTGHEVLTSSGTHLYSYDIRSSCLRTIVDFPRCVCETIPHMNTFISLKALGEDDTTTIE